MILRCLEVIWFYLTILFKFKKGFIKTTVNDKFHFTFVLVFHYTIF